MRDPITFDDRLIDAFAAYTAAAPQDVDPRALAAELAGGGRSRRMALPALNRRFGGVRLALALGLLVLASVAGLLLAGGFLRSDPAPLGADGRILVWLQGSGVHLLRDGVEVPGSPQPGTQCPVLMATADAIAVRDRFKGFAFREFAGDAQSRWFNPDYTGFERWAPDGSALAMVDMEREASVITFPDGDFVNPTVTRYPIAGAIDGFFSEDGSRLAILAAEGEDRLAIHVLEGGTDSVVATLPFAGASGVPAGAAWSRDSERLVITTTGAVTGPRLTSIDLRDGSVFHLGRPDGLAPDASLVPLTWSANGMYLVVGSDSGAAWVLDVGRAEWQPLLTPIQPGNPAAIRWSPDGRLAIVNGGWLTIHSFDDTPDRKVSLPGWTAAWSPDGRSLASVAEGGDGHAVLWSTDAGGTGESRQIAALHAADWSGSTPPGSEMPCIQWRPEVQP